MSKLIDITGQKFNRLTALRYAGSDNRIGALFEFKCDCGTVTVKRAASVRRGAIKSCGCQKVDSATRHGETSSGKRSVLYKRYMGVITLYGVCEEWKTYQGFKAWYTDNITGRNCDILIVDKTKPAGPDNCIAATKSTRAMTGCVRKEKLSSKYKGVFVSHKGTKATARTNCGRVIVSVNGFTDHISAACCYDDIVGAINPGTAWLNRDHFPEVMEAWLKTTENNKALIKLRKLHPEAVANLRFQELQDLYNTN